MEIETRPPPSALEVIKQLAASPLGAAMIEAIGQLMVAGRNAVESVAQRETPEALLKRLSAQPHEYELFAALRLVECAFSDLPRLGEAMRPRDEAIRIGQAISLAFAPSDIEAIQPATALHPPRLLQRVLGLFGPNGALPLHLTDYAYERQRHESDETFSRFADVFHHRMLSLFYRAWANSQPTVCMDRPKQDLFGGYIAALCGLGMPALLNRYSVEDIFKLAHAGIFGRQVKCADGLQQLLANYFSVQVRIDQWIGYWLPIPASERTRLGSRQGFCTLGVDTVIGERVWDCQSKFRIVLGPLSLENYLRFLPNERSHQKLADLVKLYIGLELDWDLQLILAQNQPPPAILGNPLYLGWTTWLGDNLEGADDLIIHPAGAAQ